MHRLKKPSLGTEKTFIMKPEDTINSAELEALQTQKNSKLLWSELLTFSSIKIWKKNLHLSSANILNKTSGIHWT